MHTSILPIIYVVQLIVPGFTEYLFRKRNAERMYYNVLGSNFNFSKSADTLCYLSFYSDTLKEFLMPINTFASTDENLHLVKK